MNVKFKIDGYSIDPELEGVEFEIILTDLSEQSCKIDIKMPNPSYQDWQDDILDFVMNVLAEELLDQFDYEILEE
jgi:hypothetical protein